MNIPANNNTTREAGTDSNISPSKSTFDSCKDGASTKSNNNEVCDAKICYRI